MGFPLKDPLPGQFDWILQDIRNGLVLPDHFAEDEEEDTDPEEVKQDDNPPIERASRARRQG
jgi:hypothetical protein